VRVPGALPRVPVLTIAVLAAALLVTLIVVRRVTRKRRYARRQRRFRRSGLIGRAGVTVPAKRCSHPDCGKIAGICRRQTKIAETPERYFKK